MLKIMGTVLVIFACSALGYKKSAGISERLFLLREIEKTLPEAMLRVSGKVQEPLCCFLEETAKMAQKYQGERFACIFRENAEKYLKEWNVTQKDFEEFVQLGEYLGYLDMDVQKNTLEWYLQQLKTEIDALTEEMPVKKKLYQSLGVLSGIFLAILLL